MAKVLGALALAVIPSVLACNVAGTWTDRSGNVATIKVDSSNGVSAQSVYGHTSWKSASGAVSPDGTSIWINFANGNQTGTVVNNCSAIWWENESVWGFTGSSLTPVISTVHMVFMAHLDLGYTDLAQNVCDVYFTTILPGNLALSKQLRGTSTPFAYTTHPVLVAEYLDGAAGCAHARPSPAAIQAMKDAIAVGDIRWHAQSANYLPETMAGPAFTAMLGEADRLNAAFNRSWGSQMMKSTDVVGLSRSVIPLLSAAGRKAVHMGANAKCTMAKVPQAFTWLHPETGTSLLALTTNDYGGWLIVPPHALFIQYQSDNSGPPSVAAVQGFYASAQSMFPGAQVLLSSLDNFTASALASSPGASALPVISSEIGNSWLYGGPSDPVKLAVYRETERAIEDALSSGQLSADDPNLLAYRRRILIGGPEHNGGVSIGAYLPGARTPQGNWSNALFHSLINRSDYLFVASSWVEKRRFLDPLPPIQNSSAWSAFLDNQAARVAPILSPPPPSVGPGSGYRRLSDPSAPVACGRLQVAFNASDGSIASLVDIASGHEWVTSAAAGGDAVSGAGGFLRFSYRTYTEANFTTWNEEYTPNCGVPCPNFAKQGMDTAQPEARLWLPALSALYLRSQSNSGDNAVAAETACNFVASLMMPSETVSKYGGAASLWLEVAVDADVSSAVPQLTSRLSWFNKTATRLAESSWLSFAPNVFRVVSKPTAFTDGPSSDGSGRWWIDVLGHQVYPDSVALYGTRHVHAMGRGLGFWGNLTAPSSSYNAVPSKAAVPAPVASFTLTSSDAFLVSPVDTNHLLHYDGASLPSTADISSGGMHVNLHNNLWGTAFPQWFGDDSSFRFSVALQVE